ncbi:viroplasmin family protein [Agarilytica rhodophyticola]|uniref:ribonuclease H1 domain-containing protein n=1 Tax=Agarilytica rhodophyticola TaxID=1737490 RepID=UPI000B346F11|nr:ribonuclease H family protein [Agarilytica rhodophyticola]
MAKKFYVVWKGRETGIFTDWNTCKKHVDQFPGARYKSFKTKEEAEQAFNGKPSSAALGTSNKRATASSSANKGLKTYNGDEIAAMTMDTKVFTDGGCEPNPGEAGSGIAVYRNDVLDELWYGLYNPKGTNNTAELNALHQALLMAQSEIQQDRSIAIYCDSKYSIQCITQWAAGWQKKGWKKSGGEIKNLALIKEMFALYQELKSDINIFHVNGHVGVEGNELADRMTMVAVERKDKSFSRFKDTLDIGTILAMRAG